MSEVNKNQIIQFIQDQADNDNFLNIDNDGNIAALNEDLVPAFMFKKGQDINEIEFKEIVEVLKQFIQNNFQQFEMDELVHENANWISGTKNADYDWLPEDPTNPITPIDIAIATRPWWSPIGTIRSRRKVAAGGGRVKLPSGQLVAVDLANCRKIKHRGSETSLHPNAFTAEQFEEIKNLVPGHCQIEGCYNFYSFHNATHPGPQGQEGHETEENICSFHRVYPNYHYDIMEEFGLNTTREITDEEYNDYIETYSSENNPFVKQFNKVSEKFFNKYEEFYQKFPALVNKINKKLNEPVIEGDTKTVGDSIWVGRKINPTDDEVTKSNLKKAGFKWIKEAGGDIHLCKLMKATNLMEKLFENFSPENSPKLPNKLVDLRQQSINTINAILNQEPKISSNDLIENNRNWRELINAANNENVIDNIKTRVLADAVAKKKGKEQGQKIPKDTQTEGKTKEQLKEQLERVEEFRGSQVYEDNQVKVDNLKKELSKKISQEEYARIIAQVIEKILVRYKIGYDELDSEIKKQWEKLKNGEVKEFSQVSQVEEKVVNNAGNKGARKKLDSLFEQAENALKTGKGIKKVKNRFNGFMSSNEIYEKSLLSQEAKKIESYLSQLENYSDNHYQSPSQDIPWTMIISIFSLFIVFWIGVIIYRKRKQSKSY